MKQVLISAAVICVMSSSLVLAAEGNMERSLRGSGKYGSAGCGLGSMAFQDQPGAIQILAATTNGTSGNQTFGMTSGTSNCPSLSDHASRERLNEFVLSNLDNVAKEVAMGRGESLETLAELLGVPEEGKQVVYAKLQANFSKIFVSESVQAADVIDNLVVVLNS